MIDAGLPAIPVLDCGPDWPVETMARETDRARLLLRLARSRAPTAALRLADRAARHWLARGGAPLLAEIDRIAAILGQPGAHFFNVSYDFGCTTIAASGPGGPAPRLARVLDWPTPGLGRLAIAARVAGPAGPFTTLTWPGYTGVLQAVAPGRFAAALNQAPAPRHVGLRPLDWAINARRVWRRPRLTPAHLLRRVFERAADAAEARAMLAAAPLSSGAIFTLAGLAPGETWVIERTPDAAASPDGPAVAANAWRSPGWRGRPRGLDNPGRLAAIARLAPDPAGGFDWLTPPVLNADTRLAVVAEAASGRLAAQGFEAGRPATAPLRL